MLKKYKQLGVKGIKGNLSWDHALYETQEKRIKRMDYYKVKFFNQIFKNSGFANEVI